MIYVDPSTGYKVRVGKTGPVPGWVIDGAQRGEWEIIYLYGAKCPICGQQALVTGRLFPEWSSLDLEATAMILIHQATDVYNRHMEGKHHAGKQEVLGDLE